MHYMSIATDAPKSGQDRVHIVLTLKENQIPSIVQVKTRDYKYVPTDIL